ncbi:unnamed protein product, partial [Arctogadus glacialis]
RSQPETWDAPEDWDQSSVRSLPHEFSRPEGDDKTLCVDEWPFLQTEFCEEVNQPTARVVSSQRQQEVPTPWGPKVLMAQADKPTANETSFLGCSTKITHIEDHEPFEPAPEVTASSQQVCNY